MKIFAREEKGVQIIEVGEDVVSEKAEEFKDVVETLEGRGGKQFVLEMSKVDYLCSTALGVIAGLYRKVKGTSGWVEVVTHSDRVKELFNVTRLSRWIGVYDSLDKCLSAIRSGVGRADK